MAGRWLRSRKIEAAREEIVKGVSNVVQEALRNVSESPTTGTTGGSRTTARPLGASGECISKHTTIYYKHD